MCLPQFVKSLRDFAKTQNGIGTMRIIVEVDAEGKLTIPAELHQRLDLRYVEIQFDESNESLKLRPVEDEIQGLTGSLGSKRSFEELRARAESLALNEIRKRR